MTTVLIAIESRIDSSDHIYFIDIVYEFFAYIFRKGAEVFHHIYVVCIIIKFHNHLFCFERILFR